MPGGLSLSQRLTGAGRPADRRRARRRGGADGGRRRRGLRRGPDGAAPAARSAAPVAISRLSGDLPIATPEPRPELRAARGAAGDPRAVGAAPAGAALRPARGERRRHARAERDSGGERDRRRRPAAAPVPPPRPRRPRRRRIRRPRRAPAAHRDLRLERLMSAPAHSTDQARSVPDWPALPGTFVAGAVLLVAVAALAGWIGRTATHPRARRGGHAPGARGRAGTASRSPLPARGSPPGRGRRRAGPRRPRGGVRPGPRAGRRAPWSRWRRRRRRRSCRRRCARSPDRRRAARHPRGPARLDLPAAAAVDGGRIAQVTVAPTTAGVVTAVCIAPAASWSGAAGCADELATACSGARAARAERHARVPAPPRAGPRPPRRPPRRAARPPARRTDPPRPGPPGEAPRARARPRGGRARPETASRGTRNVVRILRGTEGAYGRLALAARRGWPVRYKRARAAVRRHDRALARAVARVR